MAQDVYLSFGADASGLEAGLAAAQAAVRQTAAEMRSLASAMVKTGAAADSDLGSRLSAMGRNLRRPAVDRRVRPKRYPGRCFDRGRKPLERYPNGLNRLGISESVSF